MKKRLSPVTAFVVGGFVASAFAGYINPIYVTQILASLDARMIAVGSVLASAFPVAVGLVLEHRGVFERLYALLPVVMLLELILTAALAVVAPLDLAAYYLLSMALFGVFTNSVLYLLQKFKETKVRKNRAVFDRRVAVADGLGYLAGSALGFVGSRMEHAPAMVALLGAAQTAVVYGLIVVVYRRTPRKRKVVRSAAEEPHLCGFQEALPAAA